MCTQDSSIILETCANICHIATSPEQHLLHQPLSSGMVWPDLSTLYVPVAFTGTTIALRTCLQMRHASCGVMSRTRATARALPYHTPSATHANGRWDAPVRRRQWRAEERLER
jgi:hypothetical protein